jgi:5-methylcytosine-specific restriction endonuclease McrA
MIERYHIPQPSREGAERRFQDPTASCDHTYEVRRFLCSNGAVQYRKQCTKCGKGLPAMAKRTLSLHQLKNAPLFDRDLQENVRHAAWEHHKAKREQIETARGAKWWAWYNTYLESPVWARRRAAVLRLSGGLCEACGEPNATIAHHLKYDHVGAEPLYDLVAVCTSCHTQIHQMEAPQ